MITLDQPWHRREKREGEEVQWIRISLDPRDRWPQQRERGPSNLGPTKMAVVQEKMDRAEG